MLFAVVVFESIIVIVKRLQQNDAPGVLVSEQGDGFVHLLLQISEADDIAERLDTVQNTVCPAERLDQPMHPQILVHPQGIERRRVKSR